MLCRMFQFYLVMKGQGKEIDEPSAPSGKPGNAFNKFNKAKPPIAGQNNGIDLTRMSEKDITVSCSPIIPCAARGGAAVSCGAGYHQCNEIINQSGG